MKQRSDETPTVLVVDDVQEYIDILKAILGSSYRVKAVTTGERALKSARTTKNPPAVILLDINMPDIDGFEVCRQLKADPQTTDIPVIFITVRDNIEDVLRGFELGAVDYIPKPFEPREVISRVRSHVNLRVTHQKLEESYRSLRIAESTRDALYHMIVHDLRSMLMGVSGSLELLMADRAPHDPSEDTVLIRNAENSTERMIELVSSILDLHRLEAGEFPIEREFVPVNDLVKDAVDAVGQPANEFTLELPDGSGMSIHVDRELFRRVLINLLHNAIKFTPKGQVIGVDIDRTNDEVVVTVRDTGRGIPVEDHQRIFEKFNQVANAVNQRAHSTGIGLTFCKMAVEAHGGRIWVESEPGEGSRFRIALPAA